MSGQKLQITQSFVNRAAKELRSRAAEAGRVEFRESAYWFYGSCDAALRLLSQYRGAKLGIGYDGQTATHYFKLETPDFEGPPLTGERRSDEAAPESRSTGVAPSVSAGTPKDGPIVKSVIEIERELMALGISGEDYLTQADVLLQASGYVYTGERCACLGGGESGHHFACGYSLPTYYSVGANGTWTTEPAPLAFFTQNGARVTPSRKDPEDSGIMSHWIEGLNVGTLFPRQSQQLEFLRERGLLDSGAAGALPQRGANTSRAVRR